MNWISVNNKLPEYHQEVLVLIESQPYFLDYEGEEEERSPKWHYQVAQLQPQYKTKKPFWVVDWDHDSIETSTLIVTHWMPLPKPPKG